MKLLKTEMCRLKLNAKDALVLVPVSKNMLTLPTSFFRSFFLSDHSFLNFMSTASLIFARPHEQKGNYQNYHPDLM